MKAKFLFLIFFLNLCAASAFANNLTISNVSLETRNASANTVVVEFDISWDHSWRKADGRHDAAWVFVKLLDGNTGTPSYPWLHGKLYTAGTNPNDGTSPGTNTNLEVVVPSDKIGAFIRRKVTGNGTVSSQNVRLVVDYGTAGASDTDTITARVFGIEMVYIPEGPFYIGDGDGGETGEVINTVSGIYAGTDAFLSMFNSAGTYQWSLRLGGTSSDQSLGATVDGSENITKVGYVTGSADLTGDADTADTNETGSSGVYASSDAFISSFNSSGTFRWSERLGGTGADYGYAVRRNSSGNIISGGLVSGNADLNGDADTADSNESTGGVYSGNDGFISVFNSAGTFQWAERLGGLGDDYGVMAVAVDVADNVIAVGNVVGSADLNGDADTADTNETGNTGVYASGDIFISKFNSAGTFQWSERLGGTVDFDRAMGVATDSTARVIVTGFVNRTADLNGDADTADSGETGQTGIYASADIFLSVFNSAGISQWFKRLGGMGIDSGISVAVNSADDIIVTGYLDGVGDLNGDGDTNDSYEAGYTGVYSAYDVFVTVFNSAGTFRWAKHLGGTGEDYVAGLAVDALDRVVVLSLPVGTADLNGDGDVDDEHETGDSGVYGGVDIAVSVFDSAGTFQWAKRVGGTGDDYYAGGAILNGGIATGAGYAVYTAGLIIDNADLNGDTDAGSESSYAFHENGVDNTAVQITTTSKNITVDTNGNDDIDTSAVAVDGDGGITGNTSWPVGYNDFYMMKYPVTNVAYRDFLNTLSRAQQVTRVASTITADTVANYYVMTNDTSPTYRNNIRAPASGNGTTNPITFGCDLNANGTFNEADDGLNLILNTASVRDQAAYADWAGLRPLTELEIEKVARGPLDAVYAEYVWGTTTVTVVSTINNSGLANEYYSEKGEGPYFFSTSGAHGNTYRAGGHATNATNRKSAGASYYGVMDLLMGGYHGVQVVSLGQSTGRAFTGTHGDGVLTTTSSYEGNATNNDWPGIDATTARGVTSATGHVRKISDYLSNRSINTGSTTRAFVPIAGRTAP